MVRPLILAALCFAAMRAETVMVLPFFNHSQAANLDWIGESIAESLHDSLFSGGLLVLDRADRLEGYRRLSLRPGSGVDPRFDHEDRRSPGRFAGSRRRVPGDSPAEQGAPRRDRFVLRRG